MAKRGKPAKQKGEFEKMGDLEKGVSEPKESKKNVEETIKEIESFDATKTPPSGTGGEAPGTEGEGAAVPAEGGGEDLKKELERERDKTKNLAKIIEKFSTASPEKVDKPKGKTSDVEPKIKDIESKINDQVQSQMKEVKDAVAAIGTQVQEVAKSGRGERTGTKVKDMIDKVQADTTKKIAEIEESIKKMIEKTEAPKKGEGDVSKGLAAFGGSVDLKNKILELRSSIKDIEKSLNELRDETETRITRIKEQTKVLEKIPVIEEKVEGLLEKMSPGNIEKLKKFIFSADEITTEIIPNEIEKKVTKDLTPVFNDIKDIRDDIEKVGENIKTLFSEINFFKGELKNLYKFGDYISELQREKEKTHKIMDEKEKNLLDMVNKLESLIKKKADLMNDKIVEFEKIFAGEVEEKVKEHFDELVESKFLELEDKTEKNLAVSRAKVNDMVSKFVQFQNVVNPTISLIKEELEKLSTKLEKFKDNQADLEDEMEENVKGMFAGIAEPRINEIREEVSKFSGGVNDRLDDFEAEFVQFQNVINPTLNLLKNDLSKTDNKIEKMETKHEDLKVNVKDLAGMGKSIGSIIEGMKILENNQTEMDKKIVLLGDKINEVVEQINGIVKDSVAHQKKLEDTSKKERERINILLKELKGS